MKRWLVLLGLLTGLAVTGFGQAAPGGVHGAFVWLKTDTDNAHPAYRGAVYAKDTLIDIANAPANKPLNFHPSLVFNGIDTLSLGVGSTTLDHCTLFTVYQAFDVSHDNVIWHTTKQGKTSLVLTNNLAADLTIIKYMPFHDLHPSFPKISIYSQQVVDSLPVQQHWNIGYRPAFPHLPVISISGLIPEVIAYDRVLTNNERLQIGSYLALKYGLTLSDDGANYTDSQGNLIWMGEKTPSFHHHVAGIARDDSSALYQRKTSSSEEPGLLTVTAVDTMANHSSLIWGNNDKPLKADESQPGLPPFLKRSWLFLNKGLSRKFATELALDTRMLDVALPDKPVYWLAVDSTASLTPDAKNIRLVKMSGMDKDGIAHFDSLRWTSDQSTLFLAVAGEMLVTTAINGPACENAGSGSLVVNVSGGVAPFALTLYNAAEKIVSRQTLTNRKGSFERIGTGTYTVSVKDSWQNTYNQSFYVNSADGPNPSSVASEYTLPSANGCVTIKADSAMAPGTTYAWTGPDNFNSSDPTVQLCKAGQYTLTVTSDGCEYRKSILISPADGSGLIVSSIWPNPTHGNYNVTVSLPQRTPLTMTVLTEDGQIVARQAGNGVASEYDFSGTLRHNGVYIFHFDAEQYHGSLKLVVLQ